jgi:hypothetical protein
MQPHDRNRMHVPGGPWRHLAALFGVVLLAGVALAGCGGGKPESTAPATVAASPVAALPLMGTPVPVGDVTLVADRMTRSVGDQLSRAKRGRTWAMVVIVANNKSQAAIEVNPSDFQVTTSSGETASADITVHFLPMMVATSLDAGKNMEGRLGFDVPEKDELVLTWSPKWAAGQKATIRLVKQ